MSLEIWNIKKNENEVVTFFSYWISKFKKFSREFFNFNDFIKAEYVI